MSGGMLSVQQAPKTPKRQGYTRRLNSAKSTLGNGADLIVSGAYSHSRARALVFGGFTRSLMTACDIPVLLLH